jgi:Carboxypeptidase regulatory-like domain
LLSASKAGGQTVGPTTGAINGTVTDSTGAELPGVNIVVAGDALIGHSGTRTGLTNEKGLYRFPAIPPGEYTLTFTLKGFRTSNALVEQLREQGRLALVCSRTATAVHEDRYRKAPEWRVRVNGGAEVVPGAAAPMMVVSASSQ